MTERKQEADMVDSKSNKHVVIAMDGSEHSMYAFKWYVEKLHSPTNTVSLIHCVQYQTMTFGSVTLLPGDPTVVERVINDEEKRITHLLDKLQELLNAYQITGDVLRVQGEPGHAILKKATELNASMIVTGSRGYGVIRRTVLGSISDFLIHHSHVPVVVCKHPDHLTLHHHHHHHYDHDYREHTADHSCS